jgi:hypothetical protein
MVVKTGKTFLPPLCDQSHDFGLKSGLFRFKVFLGPP